LIRESEEKISVDRRAPEIILPLVKPWIVPLQAGAINNPNHIAVKALAFSPFERVEMRMLKLNHKAMRGTNVSNVPFAGSPIVLDNFLPIGREFVLPCAVPFGFLFGPGIAISDSPVRPMRDSVRATLGNNLAFAIRAHTPPAAVGFNTLTAYKRKVHVAWPPIENGKNSLSFAKPRTPAT
jgi:hypothetical protein